ncbi:MAG: PIN domain-containing protein [Patescibacteria group bacterium]
MELNRQNRVFVDTSAFAAFMIESEPQHEKAVELFMQCFKNGVQMITTDYIIDEVLTFLRCNKKLKMEMILSFLFNACASGIKVFGVSETLFGEAVGLMTKYKDQYFSATDCVSFCVMKEMRIKDALTTDKHFTIAGFNNLLT